MKTTDIGYTNKNCQLVLEKTDTPGTDHNQYVYIIECQKCHHRYGANGSDIFERKCPRCQGGKPGIEIEPNRPR